jgi:hypothetical protein
MMRRGHSSYQLITSLDMLICCIASRFKCYAAVLLKPEACAPIRTQWPIKHQKSFSRERDR